MVNRSVSKLFKDIDVDKAFYEYIEFVKGLGVNTGSIHWNAYQTGKWRDIKRRLMRLYEKCACLDPGEELHRTCSTRYCCNPLHYSVVRVENLEKVDSVNFLEVEELATMIDCGLLRKMGFVKYFKMFNTGNPLPADINDFYTACNLVLKKNRKRLLPVSVIGKRIRRKICVTPREKSIIV